MRRWSQALSIRSSTWLHPLALFVAISLLRAAAPASAEEEMVFEPEAGEEAGKDGKDGKGKPSGPPPADNIPPSKVLLRAKKLYDKADYYSASIEFHKVLSGQSGDGPANVQRAEFFMGKTLYHMEFYAASLAYFDRIVNAKTSHRYYDATLKWLATLSRVLPDTSGILEKIGHYDPAELDQPVMKEVRDELYYLLGRHFYRQGKFDQAIDLFRKVERKSNFYPRAKFFEGVTFVRQYQGRPAVEAFKELLVIGRERPDYYRSSDVLQFEELGNLQMARLFYSTRQYNLSIKYYEKIPQESPDWLASLFEASYAYFQKTNNSKALGNIHTLTAPYFENQFFPESMLLKSVIYYKYCLYDRALESVSEYDQVYRPLRQDLTEVLGKFEDPNEFYAYIRKVMQGKAGLAERTERLVLSVLNDRTLRKTFSWVDELEKEIKMLEKADKAWQTTAVAAEILQELNVQKSLAEADAGKLARERVQRLANELREFSRDGSKIRIEVLNARAGQISAQARGEQISGDNEPEKIIVDDEHFMWKFNGEYWKDELGFYRFRIRSQCARK
jgi:tetratricopeptide (TPR) repeat protein